MVSFAENAQSRNPHGIILNRLGEAIVPRNTQWVPPAGGPWSKKTTSGSIVDEDNVLELPDVLACVRVLSESMASLPLELFNVDDEEDETTLAKDHPVYNLLRWQPNEETTSYELRFEMMVDAIVRGYGAAQIVRTNKGRPLEIWPLEARYLRAYRAPDDDRLIYTYSTTGKSAQKIMLEASEVLLIKSFSRGGLLGHSLTRLMANTYGAVRAAHDFADEFFENGSIHSGMIEIPGELSDEAYTRLKKDWKDSHTGKGNRHRAPILEGGAKFNPLSLTNQEAQLLETTKFKRSVVAGILRVPAYLINDLEKATYNNIEHTDLGYVKHSLRPWAVNTEQRCQMSLLNASERKTMLVQHDFSDMSRGDYPSRMDAYQKAVNAGIMSPNDCRRRERMNPYEGGDIYLVQGALRDITQPYVPSGGGVAAAPKQKETEKKAAEEVDIKKLLS